MRRGRYDDYYDEVYGRTPPPRRRRKKRGRGFLLLLVLLLALGALYMVRSGGLRVLSVPQENIETDFEVDLEALAARITPDMAGADGLGAAEAQELLAAAEEAHGERADMLAFMAENIGIYSEEAYKTALVTPEKTAFALLTPFMSEQSEASAYISLTPGEIPLPAAIRQPLGLPPLRQLLHGLHGLRPHLPLHGRPGPDGQQRLYAALCGRLGGGQRPLCAPARARPGRSSPPARRPSASTARPSAPGRTDLAERLERGEIIVASMLPGDFTTSGHFILIVSSEALGFRVYDPNSMALSRRYWTYDDLAPQIAQLWSITAA